MKRINRFPFLIPKPDAGGKVQTRASAEAKRCLISTVLILPSAI